MKKHPLSCEDRGCFLLNLLLQFPEQIRMEKFLNGNAQAITELLDGEIVVLRLRPLTILFTVDWVTPLILLKRLMEISRSRHSSRIRSLTASPIFMGTTSLHMKMIPICP